MAASATECKICKKGASFDSRGFCQIFKDNNCEGSYIEFLSNNFIGEIDGISITNQAIYWANTKTDCNKCRSTFINISYQNDFQRCFTSVERESIIYDNSNTSSARLLEAVKTDLSNSIVHQTSSLANCASVDVLDATICIICDHEFYLNPSTRTCHQILNCSEQDFVLGNILLFGLIFRY